MRRLSIAIDGNMQFPSWCRRASEYVNSYLLTAGVARSVTVPAGATRALFSCTTNFYAVNGGTATAPADVTDGTAAELNPAGWVVDGGDVISVLAPADGVLTVAYYA